MGGTNKWNVSCIFNCLESYRSADQVHDDLVSWSEKEEETITAGLANSQDEFRCLGMSCYTRTEDWPRTVTNGEAALIINVQILYDIACLHRPLLSSKLKKIWVDCWALRLQRLPCMQTCTSPQHGPWMNVYFGQHGLMGTDLPSLDAFSLPLCMLLICNLGCYCTIFFLFGFFF